MKKLLLFSLLLASGFTTSGQGGTWVTRAPLPVNLTEHTSVTLNSKVYVLGGLTSTSTTVADVHVYDPAINTWSTAAPMPAARHHAGAAVVNGKIYVIGGYIHNPFAHTNTVFEYDPGTNSWSTKSPMPTTRGSSIAVAYQDKIYVIGGAAHHLQNTMGTNEVYDPATDTWATKATMPRPRDHHALVVLDTLIYAVGGRNLGLFHDRYAFVDAYSPQTDSWTPMPSMKQARGGMAVSVVNGKIYAAGGEWLAPGGGGGVIPSAEVYDPATGTWTYIAPMLTPRHGAGFATVGDTMYVIAGGTQHSYSFSAFNEAFVPATLNATDGEFAAAEAELSVFPNPFSGSARIRYRVNKPAPVSVRVSNIFGAEVAVLASGWHLPGTKEITWSAESATGNKLPAGVYFCTLQQQEKQHTIRLVVH